MPFENDPFEKDPMRCVARDYLLTVIWSALIRAHRGLLR